MDSPQTLFIEKWIKQFPNTILDSNFVNMIYEVINYAEKQSYNQAIQDAYDSAEIYIPDGAYMDNYVNPDRIEIDSNSILKLKIK